MPTSDDPSRTRPIPSLSAAPQAGSAALPTDPRVPLPLSGSTPRPPDGPISWQPSATDLDSRVARALQQAEGRWNASLDSRLKAVSDGTERSLREPLADLARRLAALEQRTVPTAESIGTLVEGRLRGTLESQLADSDRRLNESVLEPLNTLLRRLEALERRPVPTAEAVGSEVEGRLRAAFDPRFADADRRLTETVLQPLAALLRRLDAVERRPVPTAEAIGAEVEGRLRAALETGLAGSDARLASVAREATESWADRLRRELKAAVDELSARSGRAEEELRTSLAAQIDLEVLEAKEQGTALREELEGRMRELLDRHFGEAERRRLEETRELEQKVAVLVEGRTQELEKRLTAALAERTERLTAASDDRISHVERRLSAERDAKLAEFTEAHRAALGALHQRTVASVDQRLRENRAEEDKRAVALAEGLRGELGAFVDRKMTSAEFDAGLSSRIQRAVDAARAEQGAEISTALAEAESRIAGAREQAIRQLTEVQSQLASRESDLAGLEEALRAEIDDLDRRLMVVNDHVLPLVRQTWLKVSEQEFAARAKVTEARLMSVRQELSDEVRRIEAELLQQQSDLRDRLEASVASHGRIWLNLLRQFSPDGNGGMPSEALPPSHRFPRRVRAPGPSLPSSAESTAMPSDGLPFASDPPNPMDPELGHEIGTKDARRRARRP